MLARLVLTSSLTCTSISSIIRHTAFICIYCCSFSFWTVSIPVIKLESNRRKSCKPDGSRNASYRISCDMLMSFNLYVIASFYSIVLSSCSICSFNYAFFCWRTIISLSLCIIFSATVALTFLSKLASKMSNLVLFYCRNWSTTIIRYFQMSERAWARILLSPTTEFSTAR